LRNGTAHVHKKGGSVAIEVVALRAYGGIGASLIVDHTFLVCLPGGEGVGRIRVVALAATT
jgi:hypothetical protein